MTHHDELQQLVYLTLPRFIGTTFATSELADLAELAEVDLPALRTILDDCAAGDVPLLEKRGMDDWHFPRVKSEAVAYVLREWSRRERAAIAAFAALDPEAVARPREQLHGPYTELDQRLALSLALNVPEARRFAMYCWLASYRNPSAHTAQPNVLQRITRYLETPEWAYVDDLSKNSTTPR